MNLRRVLGLVPWMMRLSAGGSLGPALAILALFTLPFWAIRYLPSAESFKLTFTTLPVLMGLLTWRFARHEKWSFFVSLPVHQRELIAGSLLTDAVALLVLTSSFPKHNLPWYATQLLFTWAAILFCGWWRNLGARIILPTVVCPGLVLLQFLTENQRGPAVLLGAAAAAVLVTALEFKIRSNIVPHNTSALAKSQAAPNPGISLRLPTRAWRQTHLGMFLMSDRRFGLFLLQYVIFWLLDGFARGMPARGIPAMSVLVPTGLIAFSAGQLINGKAAEFFTVRPFARMKRWYLVAGLALFCIVPPGLTRLATTATPESALKRLEYVSFQRGGCDPSTTNCVERFSSEIRDRFGTHQATFVADVVPSPTGTRLHPGPGSVRAFQAAMKTSARTITIELIATFVLVLVGVVSYNHTATQKGRRKVMMDLGAVAAVGAGLAIEVLAKDTLPFRGLALGLAMAAVVMARLLATRRLAIP